MWSRSGRGLATYAEGEEDAEVDWIIGGVIVALLAAAMALLARRVRRRGTAGQALAAAMAAYDEGFRSTAHDSFVEMKTQSERAQEAAAPGPPRDDVA